MIRVLVVDDDFRVARLHALSVDRVEGFSCVGEVRTATDTYEAVRTLTPDLLLLDLYLPDEDGLSIMRTLGAQEHGPDSIVVTAARDIAAVRQAIQLGAFYYLVKPFGFGQLREQLVAYARWREQLGRAREADQATVDSLYDLLRTPSSSAATRRRLPQTMTQVLELVRAAPVPLGAAEVAATLGFSRPTAQRYLAELLRRDLVSLELAYGSTGRPEHRYRVPD